MSARHAREPPPAALAAHLQVTAVFVEARQPPVTAVPVGGLVAQHAAQSHIADSFLDQVQRSFDMVRRSVVVDQRGCAAAKRVDRSDAGGDFDRLGVQRLIEPPPDGLQDFEKVLGRFRRRGHADCQSRIQVRVAVHKAGQNGATVAIDDLVAGLHGKIRSAFDDLTVVDSQTTLLDSRRVDVAQERILQDNAHRESASTIWIT